MDVRICLSRTWQQSQYEPINVQVEIIQKDVTDYESAYDALYAMAEKSLVESETKLRDMYTPIVDETRTPKRRLRRNG